MKLHEWTPNIRKPMNKSLIRVIHEWTPNYENPRRLARTLIYENVLVSPYLWKPMNESLIHENQICETYQ